MRCVVPLVSDARASIIVCTSCVQYYMVYAYTSSYLISNLYTYLFCVGRGSDERAL